MLGGRMPNIPIKAERKAGAISAPAFCQALTSLLRPLFFNVSCRYDSHESIEVITTALTKSINIPPTIGIAK